MTSPAPARPGNRAVGSAGEDTAARWYQDQGFEVVDRNWRCAQGELDLVARRGRLIVFCEVKARNSLRYGAPFEAVTRAKQSRLRRLAAAWFRARGPGLSCRPSEIRFDVASISGPRLEVLEGAF